MNVGIVGAGQPSIAGLLAVMHMQAEPSPSRGFRFVYKNHQDCESYSRIYGEDTMTTRAEFLQSLRDQEFNYDEQSAIQFVQFKHTMQIFKEEI